MVVRDLPKVRKVMVEQELDNWSTHRVAEYLSAANVIMILNLSA